MRASVQAVGPGAPQPARASDVLSQGESEEPLDVTAESVPDTAATLADETARRVEALLVAQQEDDTSRQIRLDRARTQFDADAAERAEYQREMNVLRDMALEQQKRDDEFLKKMIALI